MIPKRYYHGLYEVENIQKIMDEGLRPGSSVSDEKGQASEYPIILEFHDLSAEPVSYRSGDYHMHYSEKPDKPVAIYVNPKIWTKGIRDVDTVEKELIEKIQELEKEGVSPEEIGGMEDYLRWRKYPDVAQLMEELDKSFELQQKEGAGANSPGGEERFENIKKMFPDIPTYRVFMDEEGLVDYEVSRGEKEYSPKLSDFSVEPIVNKIKILEDLYGIIVNTDEEVDIELKAMEKEMRKSKKHSSRRLNDGISGM